MRGRHAPEGPEWDEAASEGKNGPPVVLYAVLLASLVMGLAVVGLVVLRGGDRKRPQPATPPRPGHGSELSAEHPASGNLVPSTSNDFKALVAELEPVIRSFIEAPDVDALLKTIRDPERLEPAVRAYYEEEPLAPVGLTRLREGAGIRAGERFVSAAILLNNHRDRAIVLEKTEEGYRVDWESWVGWSELSWEELTKTRPTEPVLMRVIASQVEYYNFQFSNDSKWVSYRLRDRTSDHVVYGYTRRFSTMAIELSALLRDGGEKAVILRLRYPESDMRADQVLIDELVLDGWVLPDPESP